MKLNNMAYCHLQIRKACDDLSKSLGMYLETNLSEEFNEIKFYNLLGYVVVNYKKKTVFCLGHKLNEYEFDLVQDIIVRCNWLEIGLVYEKRRIRENKKSKIKIKND